VNTILLVRLVMMAWIVRSNESNRPARRSQVCGGEKNEEWQQVNPFVDTLGTSLRRICDERIPWPRLHVADAIVCMRPAGRPDSARRSFALASVTS